ncbi:hypothetical protein [Silvimonas sp.]|uniref:hypothetical protein n=1 Tax=Silvimonas sp. TaxID=2650811 RepID=UPI002847AEB5|nr:hypothetical protein [Silvimonas sp.]MDR3427912.1 hypothetical protein [Silvimonas sp.]
MSKQVITDIEKNKQTRIDAVKELLGKPFSLELGDEAIKAKRNLLAISFVASFIFFFKLKISTSISFSGVTVEGLTQKTISEALITLLTYTTIHFTWLTLSHYSEWCLRLTGTRTAFTTAATYGSELLDYPAEPRQSTLYNWWKNKSFALNSAIADLAIARDKLVSNLESQDFQSPHAETANIPQHWVGIYTGIIDSISKLHNILDSERIPASLERFDKKFEYFATQQNVRWLVFDALIPIAFALLSIITQGYSLWNIYTHHVP